MTLFFDKVKIMKKVNKKLTKDQKSKGIIFTSTLSEYRFETTKDTTYEVFSSDSDKWDKIDELKDDKSFDNSHFNFNIIRQ